MGIFNRLATRVKLKIVELKQKPSEDERSLPEAVSEAPEITETTITTHRKATAQGANNIYRFVPDEALAERQEEERKEQEQLEKLIDTLKSRFEDPENMRLRHPGMEWAKVEAKIRANKEKQRSLYQMEITGGEPDVVGYKNGEYIFFDCSKESPIGRRNLNYDEAVEKANVMGVKMLNRDQYLNKLQKIGEFNYDSITWIETPDEKRNPTDKTKTAIALIGYFRGADETAVVREREEPYRYIGNRIGFYSWLAV